MSPSLVTARTPTEETTTVGDEMEDLTESLFGKEFYDSVKTYCNIGFGFRLMGSVLQKYGFNKTRDRYSRKQSLLNREKINKRSLNKILKKIRFH